MKSNKHYFIKVLILNKQSILFNISFIVVLLLCLIAVMPASWQCPPEEFAKMQFPPRPCHCAMRGLLLTGAVVMSLPLSSPSLLSNG